MTVSPSRFRRVAGFALLAATAGLAVVPGVGSSPAASATVKPCGPSPSTVFTTCVFHDDFSGTALSSTALDGTKWRKANTSATNPFMPSGNCLRTAQVAVGGGLLHLSSKVVATPMNCYGFGANAVKTRLVGGAVTTDTKFAVTYGRIEYRAAFPADDTLNVSGLWMNPDNNTYHPEGAAWPYNGEIDVVERTPGHPNTVWTSLHYADKSGAVTYQTTGDGNPGESLGSCTVATPQDFHTYSAEWTSTVVKFYVDNVQCASLGWDPANVTPPAPFDQPFNLVASQLAAATATSPAAGSTRVMLVDWVKVWSS